MNPVNPMTSNVFRLRNAAGASGLTSTLSNARSFGGEDYKTLFVTAVTGLYSIRLTIAGTRPY